MTQRDEQSTGDPRVDVVLRSLEVLPQLPVNEHVAVFESAHVALREALADPADRPAPPPQP